MPLVINALGGGDKHTYSVLTLWTGQKQLTRNQACTGLSPAHIWFKNPFVIIWSNLNLLGVDSLIIYLFLATYHLKVCIITLADLVYINFSVFIQALSKNEQLYFLNFCGYLI